jgi:hypothetical protein
VLDFLDPMESFAQASACSFQARAVVVILGNGFAM